MRWVLGFFLMDGLMCSIHRAQQQTYRLQGNRPSHLALFLWHTPQEAAGRFLGLLLGAWLGLLLVLTARRGGSGCVGGCGGVSSLSSKPSAVHAAMAASSSSCLMACMLGGALFFGGGGGS